MATLHRSRQSDLAPLSRPPSAGAVDILVVDDDVDIRTALKLLLEDAGYVVAMVADGKAALSYLRTHTPPRLVLLDLVMPVLDGEHVVEALRQDDVAGKVPVVVCTASDTHEARWGRLAGLPILPKPCAPDVVLALVRRYCGLRRATR